MDLRLYIGIIT